MQYNDKIFFLLLLLLFLLFFLLYSVHSLSIFQRTRDRMSERSVREARGVGEESQIKNIYSLPNPYPVISPVLRWRLLLLSRFYPRVQRSNKNRMTWVCIVTQS